MSKPIMMKYVLTGRIGGMTLAEYRHTNKGMSFGGFEFECPIHGESLNIPCDWESYAGEINEEDNTVTVTHGCHGLLGGEPELDECFEETWEELGVTRDDLTAEAMSKMTQILEFYVDYDDDGADTSKDHLEIVSLSFMDGEYEYPVSEDVLRAAGNILAL